MLRHTIANILEKHTLINDDLRDISIIVTEVDASPDLKNAKVYVTRLGGGDMEAVISGLNKIKSFLRREIAKTIHLKFTPDLKFFEDKTFDEANRINELLSKPEVLRDLLKE
tara:strand:- start:6 stop:341 length:336 start_codon:yes stop_codon:yes gene_type:complete